MIPVCKMDVTAKQNFKSTLEERALISMKSRTFSVVIQPRLSYIVDLGGTYDMTSALKCLLSVYCNSENKLECPIEEHTMLFLEDDSHNDLWTPYYVRATGESSVMLRPCNRFSYSLGDVKSIIELMRSATKECLYYV